MPPDPPWLCICSCKLHIHLTLLLQILAKGLPMHIYYAQFTSVRCTLHIKMYRNIYQEEDVHNNMNSIIIFFWFVYKTLCHIDKGYTYCWCPNIDYFLYIYTIDCGAVRFGAPEGLRFYSCFRTSKLFLQLPNTPPTGSVSVVFTRLYFTRFWGLCGYPQK